MQVWQIFLALLVCVPALLICKQIISTSALPDLDYWYTLEKFTNEQGLDLSWRFITLHSNEHLIPVAGLVYLLNIFLTGGSNFGLSAFALAMGVLQTFLLAALLPSQAQSSATHKKIWWLVIALFVFTPVAYRNWLRGMSGVCWIGANTFSVLALYYFVQITRQFSWRHLFFSTAAGLSAALSYSTGLMVWPLLGLGSLFLVLKNPRPFLVYTATVIPLILLVIFSFSRPDHHDEPQAAITAARHGEFLISAIGGTFDSAKVGLVALVTAFLLPLIYVIPRFRVAFSAAFPWLLLLSYPVLNICIAAWFRAQDFSNAASASRYASLPALFILAIIILVLGLVPPERKRTALLLGIVAAIIGIIPYFNMRSKLNREITYQQQKKLAQLSLEMSAPDPELLTRTTMRDFDRFSALIPRLKVIKHVPYNDYRAGSCNFVEAALGSGVEGIIAAKQGPVTLRKVVLNKVKPFKSSSNASVGVRLFGFVSPSLVNKATCLLILNKSLTVVGRVYPGRRSLRPQNKNLSKSQPKVERLAISGYVFGEVSGAKLHLAGGEETGPGSANRSLTIRILSEPFALQEK